LLEFSGIVKKNTLSDSENIDQNGNVVRSKRKVKRISTEACRRKYQPGKTYRLFAIEEGENIYKSESSFTREVNESS